MTQWIEGRDPRTGEPTGGYWCLPDPPRLRAEQSAKLFSPEANMRAAVRYMRARYAQPRVGTLADVAHVARQFGLSTTSGMERGRAFHSLAEFEATHGRRPSYVVDRYGPVHSWTWEPAPVGSWAWWRGVGRRMWRELRAAWRDAVRQPEEYLRCEVCGWSFSIETTADGERCTECDGWLRITEAHDGA